MCLTLHPRPLCYRPAMTHPHTDFILIVDFGSQVTQLIARRVRDRSNEASYWLAESQRA